MKKQTAQDVLSKCGCKKEIVNNRLREGERFWQGFVERWKQKWFWTWKKKFLIWKKNGGSLFSFLESNSFIVFNFAWNWINYVSAKKISLFGHRQSFMLLLFPKVVSQPKSRPRHYLWLSQTQDRARSLGRAEGAYASWISRRFACSLHLRESWVWPGG